MSYESDSSCVACGISGEGIVTFHHLLTRKAYPEFSESAFNLIPVCHKDHVYFHSKGTSYMARVYPQVKLWLISHGWTNEYVGLDKYKWMHLQSGIKS